MRLFQPRTCRRTGPFDSRYGSSHSRLSVTLNVPSAMRPEVCGFCLCVSLLGLTSACSFSASDDPSAPAGSSELKTESFLDSVQRRTFDFFWETTNAENGLTPDPPFSSVAAVGYALTAYPIGVEREYVSRERARRRPRSSEVAFGSRSSRESSPAREKRRPARPLHRPGRRQYKCGLTPPGRSGRRASMSPLDRERLCDLRAA